MCANGFSHLNEMTLRLRQRRATFGRIISPLLFGLCAIALGGCAATANTEPAGGPQIELSCEPSVQVGDISAVYVEAHAHVAPLYFEADALDEKEIAVQPVDVDEAIKAAGGAGKLVAPLGHLPSVPKVIALGAGQGLAFSIVMATAMPVALGAAPYAAAADALYTAARLRHSQLSWGYFGYPQPPDSNTPFSIRGAESGYLFFPRRNYTTLEFTVSGPKGAMETIKRPWR